MPRNPLPYQCGTPGCTRKFEKVEHLHQHTKDSHSQSRPPPPRSAPSGPPPSRPPASRSPASRPSPSRPTPSGPPPSRPPASRSPPSRPPPSASPPKQRTYKCGAEGCERREPFLQLSSLHQHTAQVHPKPNRNTPSGSSAVQRSTSAVQRSTSAAQRSNSAVQRSNSAVQRSNSADQRSISAFSGRHSIPATNTRPPRRPVLMIQHLHPQVQYVSPNVYSHQPSISLAAQNTASSSDYASVASDTQEELLQRLRQLELRQMLIDKSALKVGMVWAVFPVPSRQRLTKSIDSSISLSLQRTLFGHLLTIGESGT
ncbi:hypothetical protein FB451DRAFT_767212 [Mycena latifolia]|nr:hypothetical protein FB451DRAFT_767212 [Mycena latifolia]